MKRIIFITSMLFNIMLAEDKGIGLVFFSEHGPYSSSFQSDSMMIYDNQDESSRIIAKFLLIVPVNKNAYQYSVRQLFSIGKQNFVEYGYEVDGMPFDSLNESSNWARVIFSIQSDSVLNKGWIKLHVSKNFFLWSKELLKHNLFFVPLLATPIFYEKPNGNEYEFSLEKFKQGERRYNYAMHPIRAEGQWLQVLVVSPTDFCDQPINPRKATLWIKYLDENGRPKVFYYSRGC
jgi:hypothetical protein